jgi:hypothetical protein
MSGRDGYNFSQVSRAIREDPRFASVYADDHNLAAWLRMFLEADGVWPEVAALPRRATQEAIDHLAEIGVIVLVPGDQFRMPEVDTGRSARTAAAVAAGKARQATAIRDPGSGRYATASPAPDQPALDEQPAPAGATGGDSPASSKTEASLETTSEDRVSPPLPPAATGGPSDERNGHDVWDAPDPVVEAWHDRFPGRLPTASQRDTLTEAIEDFPDDVAGWIRGAPEGLTSFRVVQHVLAEYHEWRDDPDGIGLGWSIQTTRDEPSEEDEP